MITPDLYVNEPRCLKLPNIMKAKKKIIEDSSLDKLGVSAAALLETVETALPSMRDSGNKVESVKELVVKLKEKSLL